MKIYTPCVVDNENLCGDFKRYDSAFSNVFNDKRMNAEETRTAQKLQRSLACVERVGNRRNGQKIFGTRIISSFSKQYFVHKAVGFQLLTPAAKYRFRMLPNASRNTVRISSACVHETEINEYCRIR